MKLEPEAKAPLELVEPHKIFSLTQEEIAEALGVAIAVNAGASLVYSARVMDAYSTKTESMEADE